MYWARYQPHLPIACQRHTSAYFVIGSQPFIDCWQIFIDGRTCHQAHDGRRLSHLLCSPFKILQHKFSVSTEVSKLILTSRTPPIKRKRVGTGQFVDVWSSRPAATIKQYRESFRYGIRYMTTTVALTVRTSDHPLAEDLEVAKSCLDLAAESSLQCMGDACRRQARELLYAG